jgi:hypothetical protein
VNPYVPPATPPQNLQPPAPTETPAAPDQGQQPPAQGEQPAATQIPQEYLDAHEWRGKIGEEANAFGGLDMVPQALKWSRMLFGLEAPPEGVTPAGHFMESLFRADPQVYRDLLGDIVATHGERISPLLEDQILAKHGIAKDRLPEVQDFLRYGRVSATDAAQREFVKLIKPESATIFSKLSEATRNWLVDQVDRGFMTFDFAEEQIREKGILLAVHERDEQARQREADAVEFEKEQRATARANEEIGRYQQTFVDAQARKHGISADDVLEKVAFVAGTLDAAASADERHPAKKAWDDLKEAAGSGNDLRIRAAMSRMKVVFEQAFDAYMASRAGKAPAATPAAPPAQAQPATLRQPQFEPDKPAAGEDWGKVSLDDYLFGRAAPAAR